MKTIDAKPITQAIRQLLAGPLTDPAALHLAVPGAAAGKMTYGFHCHDAWELFCPLQARLNFAAAGRLPVTIPQRHLLMVPPGLLHLSVDQIAQPAGMRLMVMNLPGSENPHGGLCVWGGGRKSLGVLSPAELTAWTAIVGGEPGVIMDQAVQALGLGGWGRERALGLLRVLIAAYAEVVSRPQRSRPSWNSRRVSEAQLFLQSHYYNPTLSVETVATAQGVSASHLGALFRKATGRSLHRTLIDLRLRRATDLLTRTRFSIKQIAALTGWSNQLYFSAAFRRRHGRPPSSVRSGNSI